MKKHFVKGKLFSPFTFTLSKLPSGIWAIVVYYFMLNEEDCIQIVD